MGERGDRKGKIDGRRGLDKGGKERNGEEKEWR